MNVASSLLLAEVAGDKVRPAEAGEDDRDENPEADHAHDDGRPLRHGQVQLSPPGNLGEKTELPDIQKTSSLDLLRKSSNLSDLLWRCH